MGRAARPPDEIAPSYVFFAAGRMSSYYSGEVLAPVGGETLPWLAGYQGETQMASELGRDADRDRARMDLDPQLRNGVGTGTTVKFVREKAGRNRTTELFTLG